MPAEAREGRKPGRRNVFWKQIVLSPEQDLMVREHMRSRRWTFQTLVDEALKVYFLGQGKRWPERSPDRDEEAS